MSRSFAAGSPTKPPGLPDVALGVSDDMAKSGVSDDGAKSGLNLAFSS